MDNSRKEVVDAGGRVVIVAKKKGKGGRRSTVKTPNSKTPRGDGPRVSLGEVLKKEVEAKLREEVLDKSFW
jgi:hypothetical protein